MDGNGKTDSECDLKLKNTQRGRNNVKRKIRSHDLQLTLGFEGIDIAFEKDENISSVANNINGCARLGFEEALHHPLGIQTLRRNRRPGGKPLPRRRRGGFVFGHTESYCCRFYKTDQNFRFRRLISASEKMKPED